jgi:hypothetical protein
VRVKRAGGKSDRRILFILSSAVIALIVVVNLLAPSSAQNDPRPTTTNSGPQGAKAAYLLMRALGRKTSRWEQPLKELDTESAKDTTLVLAAPNYDETQKEDLRAALKNFMEHGGRVLAIGPSGAALLPDSEVKPNAMERPRTCTTTPEGPGPLAQAGPVEISEYSHWTASEPQFIVEQRCDGNAVVVRYAVGSGEAIWWSSAKPLTNEGLKHDASLRLLLASVGEGRAVIFDESLHAAVATLWSKAQGLPLKWLLAQTIAVMVLLVFSFSRRRGPVRMPVTLPRSSPLEFAASMGDLYAKAGATSAATEAARRNLVQVLEREAGVARATVSRGPEAIAEALEHRFGGNWGLVASHLRDAQASTTKEIASRSGLALVLALHKDAGDVRAKTRVKSHVVSSK